MLDSLGRNIDYMRVSITDRCNLRCKYCMPQDLPFIPHENILHYEEILRLCGAAAKSGIRTVRVTGGEPLVRKGCVGFLTELVTVPNIERVTLTTNGVLFETIADDLAEAGLYGVNFSLDSLSAETYRKITGQDEFPRVWRSFIKALDKGLRVKINCVPVKGINEHEIAAIAKLAEDYPVDVRFIELMPIGAGKNFDRVTGAEIYKQLSGEYPDLTPDSVRRGFGPSRNYKSERLNGSLGIIDALDGCFCHDCNRVRLTSEGFLKPCLYYNQGVSLRDMMRSGASGAELENAFRRVIYEKPEHHLFGGTDKTAGENNMSRIGG